MLHKSHCWLNLGGRPQSLFALFMIEDVVAGFGEAGSFCFLPHTPTSISVVRLSFFRTMPSVPWHTNNKSHSIWECKHDLAILKKAVRRSTMIVLNCLLFHSEHVSIDVLGLSMSNEVVGCLCLEGFSWHKSLSSHRPLVYLAPAPLLDICFISVWLISFFPFGYWAWWSISGILLLWQWWTYCFTSQPLSKTILWLSSVLHCWISSKHISLWRNRERKTSSHLVTVVPS